MSNTRPFIGIKSKEKNSINYLQLDSRYINEPLDKDLNMNNMKIINCKEGEDETDVCIIKNLTVYYKKGNALDMNNQKITNVQQGSDENDVATMKNLQTNHASVAQKLSEMHRKGVPLDMGMKRIKNLDEGLQDDDAVSLKQVRNMLGSPGSIPTIKTFKTKLISNNYRYYILHSINFDSEKLNKPFILNYEIGKGSTWAAISRDLTAIITVTSARRTIWLKDKTIDSNIVTTANSNLPIDENFRKLDKYDIILYFEGGLFSVLEVGNWIGVRVTYLDYTAINTESFYGGI